jgi:protein-S-isoprenylcysteine O-methyltransferase Ste14
LRFIWHPQELRTQWAALWPWASTLESVGAAAAQHRRFRWRGGVGAALLIPAALLSLFSPPLIPPDSWWHLWLRGLAWATFLAGAFFRFWATLWLGGRKEKELVYQGPYSLVRHPLYLGSLLIGAGAGLFLESLAFELLLVVVALVYVTGTIRVEEDVLRSRFGEAYDQYAARVPRFWPFTSRLDSAKHISVDVNALRLECARASRWVWIPAIGATFTFLRDQPWWPHVFRLIR